MELGTWAFDAPWVREGRLAVWDYAPRIALCGTWLCDHVEGWGPMSPVREFDLTPCFQAVLLWLVPSLLFLVLAFCSLRRLTDMPVLDRGETSLNFLHEKDGITTVIALLGVAEVVVLATLRLHATGPLLALTSGVQILASVVVTLAYVCALLLQHANHLRERHSSDAAVLLWLVSLFAGPVRVRTLTEMVPWASVAQLVLVVPLCMRLLLIAVMLVLESQPVEGEEGTIALPEDEGMLTLGEAHTDEAPPVDPAYQPAESPLETANLFSRLTFHWMQPMMSLGAKRFLTETDMWALPRGEDTEHLGDAFQREWAAASARSTVDGRPLETTRRVRFWTVLLRAYGRLFVIAALFKVVQDLLAFTQPQILRGLLGFVQHWESSADPAVRGTALRGYVLAFLLFLTAIVQMACLHQYFQLVSVAGMRTRAGVVSAIFRKSLRLSNEARGERASGDVVNLMSVDANRLPDFVMYAHILWSGVFQITIAFISLYNLLGWSAFVGVAIMVVSVPMNMVLATYLRKLSARMMKVKDRRTQIMNEIILNIKSIKLFAWEQAFTERLLHVRDDEELPLLRKVGMASAGFNFFWQAIPFFVSLGTFVAFSLTSDKPLTADIVFPALSLYQLLNFPMSMLAGVLSMFLQTQVSADRLASFFDAGELDPDARDVVPIPDGAERPNEHVLPPPFTVEMRNGTFAWSREQHTPVLSNISLQLRPGELVAVLGRVGDGKSSLLEAILGEMVRLSGEVVVHGEVAYFSQGGWCMGASIRDNILFGREFNEAHYKQCLFACALEPDLELFADGDRTEIGERGVSLSGGQRARVALARACYASADVYLLDDPLAAVDAHVGAHIWTHVLGPSGMLQGRTRILTLNAVSYLSGCDKIISLRRGALLPEQGTFAEVMAMRGEVYRLITGLGRQSDQEKPDPQQTAAPASACMVRPRELAKDEIKVDTIRQLRESSAPKEKQETGMVKWAVYDQYIKSASFVGVVLYFCAHVLTQVFSLSRDVVLKQWSAANERHGPREQGGIARFYLTLYAVVGLLSSVGFCIAPFVLYVWLVLSSARHFHNNLFLNVMRYPLQWFETTPTGRLLNLFSRDISVIDETLPRVIQGFVRSFVVVLGVVCVVSYSVPSFILFVIPLGLLYRAVMRYYLASSRELKRIDAVSKSPVFTWFQESLGGLTTIRAYDRTASFTDAFEARVDRNQMCYFPAVTCNRWLAVRIELLGSSVIFFASTMAVFMVTSSGAISAGLLGLMLSQVLSTTQTLNWAVRSASEVEQNIVSVERVIDYSDLPQEAAYTLPGPDRATWPSRGEIEFRHYGTQYRPGLPPVLHDLSFKTRPGERIGVVGRTGAGKSTLTLALFRILEATQGKIMIDGVDIATLGLRELRDALAIIPQDPQLWQGSLRDNLDPLHHYSDAELMRVLDQARLTSLVGNDPAGLDQQVAESGTNLSAGQRQLVCIARALVRRTKVLVLDEATSSVDLETDDLVQRLVRSEFHGTTITIAHRLNTILDSDRVLVLQNGSLAEFDTPTSLLKNDQSLFYSMALEAGLFDAIAKARGTPVRKDEREQGKAMAEAREKQAGEQPSAEAEKDAAVAEAQQTVRPAPAPSAPSNAHQEDASKDKVPQGEVSKGGDTKDSAKDGASQGDASKKETPNKDAPKDDAPKNGFSQGDAPKPDAPKESAPKGDASKSILPKEDAAQTPAPSGTAQGSKSSASHPNLPSTAEPASQPGPPNDKKTQPKKSQRKGRGKNKKGKRK